VRFEVATAFAVGALLPVLETARRGIGHWLIDSTTMLEDYVAGALLLIAAWACYSKRHWGSVFLVLAWGYFTGLMSSSFWNQLEETIRQTATEPNSGLVLCVKLVLWVTCVTSLCLSFRSASRLGRTL
jgi:uncharacterized membrane protein YidH (DUF202 family)